MATLSEEALALDVTAMKERLERNPYGIVAGAFGVGFVLGGGLFTRVTARLVNAAVRLGVAAALPYLQEELLSVAGRAMSGGDEHRRRTSGETTQRRPDVAAPAERQGVRAKQ